MSSTLSICQGLQTCLEPILPEPHVLMHQLAPFDKDLTFPWPQKTTEIPRPENPKNLPIENNINGEKSTNAWNSIQSLTNSPYNCRQLTDDSEQVYVHPLVKRSASSLSAKSLEMCTESLGSETGSNIDLSIEEFSYLAFERHSSSRINPPETQEFRKKSKHSSSFPPPLTSISGNDGVQVQTHREEGRLVIKAFSIATCSPYFLTERENGRLRLSLLKDGYGDSDSEMDENEEEVGEENGHESGDKDELNGCFWRGNLKEEEEKVGCKTEGGGEWSCCRCHGGRSDSKRLQTLPFCTAIS